MNKVLIPVKDDQIAPRFDLANEFIIAQFEGRKLHDEPRTIIMERASAEELCQIIVEQKITHLICGGIDEEHYNLLVWKKVSVQDAVIGRWQTALEWLFSNRSCQGRILPCVFEK